MHLTHVLLTRPLEVSLQLAGMLAQHAQTEDLRSIVMPFYKFSAYPRRPDLSAVWSFPEKRKLVVFTSTRAVKFGLGHIPMGSAADLEFASIGPATAARLEEAGLDVAWQASSGFTSEDLLQLPALAETPGTAVIFCAPGGRVTLAHGLEKLGWHVVQAMVYQRLPAQPPPDKVDMLLDARGLLTIWTSVSALELAEKNLPEAAWSKILGAPALVISARIQHHLQQRGANRVELAGGPGNAALLQSVSRLSKRQKPA